MGDDVTAVVVALAGSGDVGSGQGSTQVAVLTGSGDVGAGQGSTQVVALTGSGGVGAGQGFARLPIFGSCLSGSGEIVGGHDQADLLYPSTFGHAHASAVGTGDDVITPQRAKT